MKKSRYFNLKLSLIAGALITVTLFQNCSGVNSNIDEPSVEGLANSSLQFYDNSTSDGSKVLRVTQRFVGLKGYTGSSALRGCTAIVSDSGRYCQNDSEFRVVGVAGDTWTYNSSTDTFSVDMDVSSQNWPQTTYVTRYIFADGQRKEFTWTPRQSSNNSVNTARTSGLATGSSLGNGANAASESALQPTVDYYAFSFSDYSTTDGTKVLRVTQRFSGVKKMTGSSVLRGCTVTIGQSGRYCKNASDFRVIGGAGDTWSYNANTDTYSVDMDVSNQNWPQTVYITRYIFADGTRGEFDWTPKKK